MLLKLIKHEFIGTYKQSGGLIMAFLLLTLTLCGLNVIYDEVVEFQIFVGLLIVLFIIYIITVTFLFFTVFALNVKRFSKNIFSEEGYLTNTLPVSASQIIISKSLVAMVWSIAASISVVVSVYILQFCSFGEGLYTSMDINIKSIFDNPLYKFRVSMMAIIFLLSLYFLCYYAVASGRKSGKKSYLKTFFIVFAIFIAWLIVLSYIFVAFEMDDFLSSSDIVNIFTVYQFIMCVIFYIATRWNLKNNLNLE